MGKLKDFTDKVWYGTGAIGLDLSYGMFNGRLSKYLTDVLGLRRNPGINCAPRDNIFAVIETTLSPLSFRWSN